MFRSDVDKINDIANEKYNMANNNGKVYLLRAIMAGFYLVVAIILSYSIGAILYNTSKELSKIATAATFSIALALICFLGGELFTGNNLIMGISFYDKKKTLKNIFKVWGYSYIGNLIGSLIIGSIFVYSGSGSDVLPEFLNNVVTSKLNMNVVELLLRGILCNFIVCISVLCHIKMKSETGKMIAMFWLIFTFVLAGFEHSIANMGIFTISMLTIDGINFGLMINNMIWVTIGNIIGGAILYAYPLYLMSNTDKNKNTDKKELV